MSSFNAWSQSTLYSIITRPASRPLMRMAWLVTHHLSRTV